MKKILFVMMFLIAGMSFVSSPRPVFSAEWQLNVGIENPLGGTVEIKDIIAKILKVVVEIALPIVILMVIYSGFLYVMSRGNSEAVEKAHTALTYTLIGAAILLGAQLIATILVDTISSIATDSGVNNKTTQTTNTSNLPGLGQACVPPATTDAVGAGICQTVSSCTTGGYKTYSGVCAGDASIMCCALAKTTTTDPGNGTPDPGSGTVTVPSAPTNFVATPGDGKVTLSWDTSSDTTIEKYVLEYGTVLNRFANSIEVSHTNNLITNLTNNVRWYFSLAAYNSKGKGAVATYDTMPISSNQPKTVPSAVSDFTVIGGDQKATLSWSAPYDGGSAITGYTLYYAASKNPPSSTDHPTNFSASDTNAELSLANDIDYYFVIYAKNAQGTSVASAVKTTKPGAGISEPANFDGGPGTNSGEVKLTWDTPTTGGSKVTKYILAYNTGTAVEKEITANQSSYSYTVTGLTPDTQYGFKLTPKTATGSSGNDGFIYRFSQKSSGAGGTSTPPILTLSSVASTSAVFTWKDLKQYKNDGKTLCTVSSFNILYDNTGGSDLDQSTSAIGSTKSSYTVTGLTTKTDYWFKLYAFFDTSCDSASFAESDVVTAKTN